MCTLSRMTDLPDDPHRAGAGRYGQSIKDGKLLLDTLQEQRHYTTLWTLSRRSRIDGIVALMMSLDRLENQPKPVEVLGWL